MAYFMLHARMLFALRSASLLLASMCMAAAFADAAVLLLAADKTFKQNFMCPLRDYCCCSCAVLCGVCVMIFVCCTAVLPRPSLSVLLCIHRTRGMAW